MIYLRLGLLLLCWQTDCKQNVNKDKLYFAMTSKGAIVKIEKPYWPEVHEKVRGSPTTSQEFHETCPSVTLIVLVNSHQRWEQTWNRICFHLCCELTLVLWCHSIVWSLFSWNKMWRNYKSSWNSWWLLGCVMRGQVYCHLLLNSKERQTVKGSDKGIFVLW